MPRSQRDDYHLLSRKQQVVLVRLRTGHNRLNSHMHGKLKLSPSPTCRCGQEGRITEHVLQRCPLHKATREDVWPVSTRLTTKLYVCKQELEKTTSFISRVALIVQTANAKEKKRGNTYTCPGNSVADHQGDLGTLSTFNQPTARLCALGIRRDGKKASKIRPELIGSRGGVRDQAQRGPATAQGFLGRAGEWVMAVVEGGRGRRGREGGGGGLDEGAGVGEDVTRPDSGS